MNKKEFLKELEKKLMVLNETERKDIINEYKDTIEEKVKHGQTEEDAVKDFGSIDDLSKEILSAYKINPEYGKDSDLGSKAKDVLKSTESFVKVGAKKLSEFTKNIVEDVKENKDMTPELIFEIIIKVFIFLLMCAVLRLPFWLFEGLGSGLLNIFFPPFDIVFKVIWYIVIYAIYFIACVLLGITMFKEYFHPKEEIKKKGRNVERKTKGTAKKESVSVSSVKEESDEKPKKELISEEKEDEVIISRDGSTLGYVFMTILRVFATICFLIPMWCAIAGIYIGITFAIYLLIKGVAVAGLLLILIGCAILFGTLVSIVHRLLFTRKRVHFSPLIISIIFMFCGALVFTEAISNFEYIDSEPTISYVRKEEEFKLDVNDSIRVSIEHGDKEIVIDNELPEDEVLVKMYYYDEFMGYKYNINKSGTTTYVNIKIVDRTYKFNRGRKMFNVIIDDLKNDRIYNYEKLSRVNVKIYVNEINVDKIN